MRDERGLELTDTEVHILVLGHAFRRPVHVRNRQTHDFRRERAEAALEQAVLAGETQGQKRAAVIPAFETNDRWPPGVLARQLDGVLHGLGAAVGENRLLAEVSRSELVQELRKPDIRLVRRHQRAWMDALRSLLLNGPDHGSRRMPHGQHADAAGQIDERVAVGVENQTAIRAVDDNVGGPAEAGRRGGGTAGEHVPRPRSGNFGMQPNVRHGQFA